MIQEDIYQTLLNASFRFLSFRPRSAKEIEDFLQKKTKTIYVHPDVYKHVADRLTELGYIDDAKFAAWWIEARQKTKPKGMRLIRLELKKKGIAQDIIEEILHNDSSDEHIDHVSEEDLALAAIQKKKEIWKRLPKLEQKKKMYDFLGRRGFSFEVIRRIIDGVVGKGYNSNEVE